jgi:uncharacterized protein (DUF1778 family)
MARRTSSKKAPARPRSEHESAVIADWEAIRLTAADSLAFAEALLHPRELVPELRAAANRYRKLVGGGE